MKEFDYELAKAGKPVCTRDGKPARIVCWDRKWEGFPILALVTESCGEESSVRYTKEGKHAPVFKDIAEDLMMVCVEHDGWINLYSSNGKVISDGTIHDTEVDAKENLVYGNYIQTIKIHWEE